MLLETFQPADNCRYWECRSRGSQQVERGLRAQPIVSRPTLQFLWIVIMLVLGSGLSNLSLRAFLTDTVCVWQRFVGFVVTNTIVAGHTSCQAHVTPCVKLSPTLRYITVLPLLQVSAISRIPSSTSRSRLKILLGLQFINFDLLCSKTSPT